MTGVQIEFLLGLFFLISGLAEANSIPRPASTIIKIAAGIILLILAVIHLGII